jgi:hypothetical protein
MDYEFKVSKSSKAVVNSALLFFWIALPLIAYVFLESILALITGQANLNNATIALIASAYGLFVVMTVPLQIVNQYNRIRTVKDGLYVEVYIFRYIWKFIDWGDILDLKQLPKHDRWGKPQWLIKVKDLTYWHRWISWQHKSGLVPGIIITSDLIDQEKLLKIVQRKLTKSTS